MTKPLPFTKASVKRRIAAAREAGLRVIGVAADGTVLVDESGSGPLAPIAITGDNADTLPPETDDVWGDVQA